MTTAALFHRAALDHLRSGDFADAADACRAGLAVAPDHPDLTELLGVALHELDEPAAALHALETASALVPLSVVSQLALAELYARFGQPMAALAVLDFLAEPGRCPPCRLPDVARGFGRLGRYESALAACVELIRVRPGHAPAYYGAAFYLSKLGRGPGQVLPFARTAFDLAPHVPDYRMGLAALLARMNRPAEAYDLIRDIPAEALCCRDCVARLLPAVEAAGDHALADAYRSRMARLVAAGFADTPDRPAAPPGGSPGHYDIN